MGLTVAAARCQSWSNAVADGWIVSHCAPWGMKNTPVLYLKLMDSASKRKKKRCKHLDDWEDGERFGYHTIKRSPILCHQYGGDQNSPFLTKRRSNEGLSISVDWLVNLSIMSILKASGLATAADGFKLWKCTVTAAFIGEIVVFSLLWHIDPLVAMHYTLLTSHCAGK